MGKVVVWNLMSLDGYFEGASKWDLDFHLLVWGPELEALSKEFGEKAEALVFGRVTYEGMKAYWTTTEDDTEIKTFMNALPKIVASRTLKDADWNNSRVASDIAGELKRLKQASGKNIYIFGSAELVASLLPDDVIDEIMVCVVPVLLGRGTRLFKPANERTSLKLLESRPLQSGGVILRYETEKSAA
ncbi:dihydrofolate reductase [Rhizobium herbae]|uniref:Dihydrofolate reductase n=1 Tax=Rhizobium herbae TaxID=508661 RepID=A0ABS7H8J1_9HYPH|nr:dihydrofolate reductase family protein [Rhizobium herbae]MBW9063562.1 dihydrofolate reductase [Rhizobium herbae]